MVKPFEPTDNFTKIHNALFELYTRLPDFKPDHALMYIVLMSYWNAEKGYAFPTKASVWALYEFKWRRFKWTDSIFTAILRD